MKHLYIYDNQCGKQIYFKDKKAVNKFVATVAEETVFMKDGGNKKQIKQDIAKLIYIESFWE